jgi:hypothetical protein
MEIARKKEEEIKKLKGDISSMEKRFQDETDNKTREKSLI